MSFSFCTLCDFACWRLCVKGDLNSEIWDLRFVSLIVNPAPHSHLSATSGSMPAALRAGR